MSGKGGQPRLAYVSTMRKSWRSGSIGNLEKFLGCGELCERTLRSGGRCQRTVAWQHTVLFHRGNSVKKHQVIKKVTRFYRALKRGAEAAHLPHLWRRRRKFTGCAGNDAWYWYQHHLPHTRKPSPTELEKARSHT